MNDWCFRPRFCTVKAKLGRRLSGYLILVTVSGLMYIVYYTLELFFITANREKVLCQFYYFGNNFKSVGNQNLKKKDE